ncbi:MAG: hypothetical protein CL840_10000 [Crocinitomicaceae bacterium]|nr:hypothetical protein [Crocinitomicaceae bacterium]|tara:strand:+ start:15244 stop:20292 length:5049 start_codon:yes stop_codon:yes gene_type:complete
MKRLGLLLTVLAFHIIGYTQPFGNEWINYNQRYLKIPVIREGIYRVNYQELNNAFASIGVSLSNVDPRNIQVYGRGQEQFIFIDGEANGKFDATDYIMFYANKNDGWFDRQLYIKPEYLVNPYYSLFNDTAWYYITYSGVPSSKRYKPINNTVFSGKTKLKHVFNEEVATIINQYNEGEKDRNGVSPPLYQNGEGWVGYRFYNTIIRIYYVPCKNPLNVTGTPNAKVTAVTVGQSNAIGSPNHGLLIEYGPGTNIQTAVDTSYNGYQMIEHQFEIPASSVTSLTQIRFRKKPLIPEPPSDFQAAAYAKIKYAHDVQLAGEDFLKFNIPDNADTSYVSFSGAGTNFFPYALDLENGYMSKAVQTGSTFEFLIAQGTERPVVISRSIINVSTILPSYSKQRGAGWMTDLSTTSFDSAFVILSHQKLWSSALQYQSYRSSKGFNAILVDIDDLYDQFSYGIKKHPLAIKNFLYYVSSIPNNKPGYLFIIGKSVKENLTRLSPGNQKINLIPTMGVPPADNIITAPLDNQSFTPSVPTGRLASTNNQNVLDYLDKVMDFEKEVNSISPRVEDKAWTKRGIHFAGGADINQQRVFSSFLSNYEDHWEGNQFGGKIETFKRFASGSVQSISFDSVKYWIDDGVSLLSFFGHGSGGQLGINIGEPEDYNNTGKYPIFIANSCNVGDFHLPNTGSTSINEKWVLQPKGGVVGFIASTSTGYDFALNTWSNPFYRRLAKDQYGQAIGDLMKDVIIEIEGGSKLVNQACMEINLHGDPALKLYPKSKADFAIRKEDISAPKFTSIDQGTMTISYTIHNLGKGIDTLVPIQLIRTLPSGKDTVYLDTIKGVANRYNGSLSLFISNQISVGENKFVFRIDPDNTIDEIYPVINNFTESITVNVTSDDLIPVHPGNYSIQPGNKVTLSASTADPDAPSRAYQFEIDVTDSYNSAQLKRGNVTSFGGLIQWQPNMGNISDSTVFFWRCSPSDGGSAKKWREYSFQYIPNQTGWSQYKLDQFKNNRFVDLTYDKPNQKFDFAKGQVNISAANKGNPTTADEYNALKWSINGNLQGMVSYCGGLRSMIISVIDPNTFKSWEVRWDDGGVIKNPNNNFGNYNDGPGGKCFVPDNKFQFLINDSMMMDSMIWMINTMIPDSFYVLVMSGNNANFQNSSYWKNRHYQAFEDLGSDSIRFLNNDVPYILFAQKGNKSKAIEVIGSHAKAAISLSAFVQSSIKEASMEGVTITNSTDYKSLYWNYERISKEDSIVLTLHGKDTTGSELELLKIDDNTFSVPDLKSVVPNINQMQDLQLKAQFKDSLAKDAPQLKNWLLMMEEPLELALCPRYKNSFHNDTLTQGENLKLELGLKNLSATDADSVTIRYLVLNKQGDIAISELRKTKPLAHHDSLILTYGYNTSEISGEYTLFMDVNPEDTLWQPEGEHFNNVTKFDFYVKADRTNPLLDVTFDGVHILDGDIVSSRPEILISLTDENQFKPVDDTSNFEVYLTYPNRTKKRIYFQQSSSDYEIEFIPPSGEKNKGEVRFSPILLEDGDYELQVDTKDASQNKSGSYKYKIGFEVINKSTITQILNYPNPFSTSTRFVFTLTGYQVPEYFRIQILSATGVVVREIDRDELGSLHIGRNITSYAWDGRDQYGDQLANGVYFYRVITKINNEEIEHRSTAADSYFKKGFGKMYLLR